MFLVVEGNVNNMPKRLVWHKKNNRFFFRIHSATFWWFLMHHNLSYMILISNLACRLYSSIQTRRSPAFQGITDHWTIQTNLMLSSLWVSTLAVVSTVRTVKRQGRFSLQLKHKGKCWVYMEEAAPTWTPLEFTCSSGLLTIRLSSTGLPVSSATDNLVGTTQEQHLNLYGWTNAYSLLQVK